MLSTKDIHKMQLFSIITGICWFLDDDPQGELMPHIGKNLKNVVFTDIPNYYNNSHSIHNNEGQFLSFI